ncbi:PREDICTED: ras-related protein RabJ isoform X2 [Acromyrmex echinatior]|uniref:ras-related protein RabJ isoform X2 n=1 Tax=Acromyrmex echinatior TaxID=103372 RepID=UPI000580EB73|nr:PREDICTED: ras-related protein RabJ isoform X2 [Acromyrmex echinatior]
MKTIEGKVIMLGSQGVGKTSLIGRYVGNVEHVSPTIAASFFNCKINLEDVKIKLQVWDTAGQERFRSMAPMYYRTCNAALLVFDLTQYSTFVAIKSWVKELQQNVEETMVLVLIGNKSDLVQKRQVDGEEGRRNDDMLLPSPSIEESPQNTSIAHGIHEKPFTCC